MQMFPLCVPTNSHEKVMSIDFGIGQCFSKAVTNMECMNSKVLLYLLSMDMEMGKEDSLLA